MAKKESSDPAEIREVLINALEVEMAALKAAVGFWRQWVEHTSAHLKATASSLSTIRSEDKDAGQVLLELVDSSRERMRTMTELPRNAAVQFIRELDEQEKRKRSSAKSKPGTTAADAPAKSKKTTKKKRVAKRRARAKP